MTQQVAIIGAGQMGHGFAAHFIRFGLDVTLIDHRKSNLERAKCEIRDVLEFLNGQQLTTLDPAVATNAIKFTTDRLVGVNDVDLVLETIHEDLATKQAMFENLVEETSSDTLLASNTSGLPITEIAATVPEDAGRIVGCHWWFPPYLLEPVEIIPGENTDEAFYEQLVRFVESVDRKPVRVQCDVPGFVWNRIQYAIIRECLHLAEEGVASLEDINMAIRDGYAVRTSAIGPLETLDYVGLDLVKTVGENLYPELANDQTPHTLLDERIETGRTGIDDGEGLLEYNNAPEALLRERDERIAAIRKAREQ